MRLVRSVLVVLGGLIAAYGGWLLYPQQTAEVRSAVSLLGGPALHDALLAPLVGLLGIAVATLLPQPWRAPAAAGLVVSGVLLLIALPALVRQGGGPTNPGLHDGDYLPGLAAALEATWLVVGLVGALRLRNLGPRRRAQVSPRPARPRGPGQGQRPGSG